MNTHVNAIANRLSLRKPQRDALEILARVCEIIRLEKDADAAQALETIKSEYPTVADFERDFPSLCYALATGIGKTRLMGAFICCDAGPGQFSDTVLPYGWATRMQRSFEATHRQVQHGLQSQLHFCRQHGQLQGFIYSYLGQQDKRLPLVPPDLIRREEVIHYPTDFSGMSDHDIDLLARRGEQLTRLLIDHYCPVL